MNSNMNFGFLSEYAELHTLRRYCGDAQRFARLSPVLSVSQAKKAAEYMLKLFFALRLERPVNGVSVYDILSDWDFMHSVPRRELIDAFRFVHKTGQNAAQGEEITGDTAVEALERLHFFIGECCLLTGLVGAVTPFDVCEIKPEDISLEAEPESGIAERLALRLSGRTPPVPAEQTPAKLSYVHVDPREERRQMREGLLETGTDSAANAKLSFHVLAGYIMKNTPGVEMHTDPLRAEIGLELADRRVTVSVRSGCTNLGTKDASGEWQLLSGIDYIIYAPSVTEEEPLPDQFRVMSRGEFLRMWQELGLIRYKVSSHALKRYREMFGSDKKFDAKKYGDVQCVQSFLNSRTKTERLYELLELFPRLSGNGIGKILSI